MSEQNGVMQGSHEWDWREPIFRDVPFEESEWAGLYAVLRQVNPLKAELVRVQYEAVHTAYQNYLEAYKQELDAYAQRRREDEAYNREVYDRRQQTLEQIESIRQRWQGEINRLREMLDAADVEAYRRAGLAGITLRGDPLLGIGLPDEMEQATPEHSEPTSSGGAGAAAPNASAPSDTTPPSSSPVQPSPTTSSVSLWERLTAHRSESRADASASEDASSRESASASRAISAPNAPAEITERIEPLTPEEAAHAAHLPTNQALVIPYWLHWLAPILIGLAVGQILLVAAGRPIGDWETLAFWIASLGGMLAMLLWYRAVWGVSRSITELYYLFDWGAVKARRAARLGGLVLILLLTLPTALLVFTLFQLPLLWTRDLHLLTALALLAILPLLGLALVGGYLQGREQVVRNAIKSAVVAAKRQQQQHERAQSEQTRLDLERERTEQARQHTEQMRLHSELEQERLAIERLRIERGESPPPTPPTPVPLDWNMPALEPVDSPNGESTPVNGAASAEPVSAAPSPTDRRQRLDDAREAIGSWRGVNINFIRAREMMREMMQEELAPYEQMLRKLQPRPIYDSLPPWAGERLQTLYRQWCDAYGAFLDCVAEATRDCKDSEQIQQRIANFKQTLTG